MKNFFRAGLIVLSAVLPALCFSAAGTLEAGAAQQPASDTSAGQANPQSLMAKDVMISRPAYTKEEMYMITGDKFFKAGNYPKALSFFYAATKLEPKDIKAWKKTAFCYYQLGKHNYAYSYFQKVLQMDKADKDSLEFMEYYKTIIDKSKKVPEKREMADSIWRSAVLPGFGQFYNNQGTKGIVVGGTFLVSLGLALYGVADEKMKYQKYIRANENQDIAYKEAQDAYASALTWGIIAAAAYAGAMIDAGMNYNCDEARNVTIKIKDNGICLAADYRW